MTNTPNEQGYPTPSGDDAHPADEPDSSDDAAADLPTPSDAVVDEEADQQFRDAVEPE